MSGFSENIICPYCGYEAASSDWENKGPGRGTTKYCDICGWYEYEPAEGYNNPKYPPVVEKPTKKTIKRAKEAIDSLDIVWDIDDDGDFTELVMQGKILEMVKSNKDIKQLFISEVMK